MLRGDRGAGSAEPDGGQGAISIGEGVRSGGEGIGRGTHVAVFKARIPALV
jgi:hypothetical protein